MSKISFRRSGLPVSAMVVLVVSGFVSSIGAAAGPAYSRDAPPDSHCWVNRMEPPRAMGETIVFDASIKCDPKPVHSNFIMKLMKVDHGLQGAPEHQVARHEYSDPRYSLEDGFFFTEYHDCSRNPAARVDGYYTLLHITQWNDGFPTILDVKTESRNLLC
ncbi:hypothetical protein V7968_31960 [Nocardia vulneris]